MPKPVVPEEKRRRRRPTKSGTVLSERLIVETALRILREHASAALTARCLGRALDAGPSTRYRFVRGMDVRSSGSGLGLTIAIRIARVHGCQLDIQSTVGTVANFSVILLLAA